MSLNGKPIKKNVPTILQDPYLFDLSRVYFYSKKIKTYRALKLNDCDSIQKIFKLCDKGTVKALPND